MSRIYPFGWSGCLEDIDFKIGGLMPFERCNGINVYYEIHGDKTPLLFLNGLSSDIPPRMKFINVVKKHFKIIIPDLRGAGFTDKPHESYSIAQFAEDARGLVGELAFEKINVMGFSMGGCIAINLAILYPEIIERLILVSTKPAWTKPCGFTEEANRILHSTELSEGLLTDLFNLVYGPDYKKRVPPKGFVEERMANPNPQPIHGYLNQLRACEEFDLLEEIKTIRAPTLIITGKEDKLVPPQNSCWLHDNIKNSKLIVYDGAGHMPVDECTERLVADVSDFCSSSR